MFALIVWACLIDEPKRCREWQLTFEGTVPAAAECMVSGQFALAKWQAEHPNYTIKTWYCEGVGHHADL